MEELNLIALTQELINTKAEKKQVMKDYNITIKDLEKKIEEIIHTDPNQSSLEI